MGISFGESDHSPDQCVSHLVADLADFVYSCYEELRDQQT